MLPQASKEFLVRIRFFWRPFFQGRYLLLTNTLSAGGMLALGDCLQQSWEIHKDPSRVRNWRRTGEREKLIGGLSLLQCGNRTISHVLVYSWLNDYRSGQKRLSNECNVMQWFLWLTVTEEYTEENICLPTRKPELCKSDDSVRINHFCNNKANFVKLQQNLRQFSQFKGPQWKRTKTFIWLRF